MTSKLKGVEKGTGLVRAVVTNTLTALGVSAPAGAMVMGASHGCTAHVFSR